VRQNMSRSHRDMLPRSASSGRGRRRWSLWRSLLAITFAFAGGCIPAARLAAAFAPRETRERLATANPGTSSVYRIMGKRAAVPVFLVDCLKGLLPPLLGRAAGADPVTVDALMLAPLAGHITVGGGRGVATLAGSVSAGDAPGFLITLPLWVLPTIKKDHGRGVLVACLLFPIVRGLLGRGRLRVVLGLFVPLLLVYGRLRGPGWAGTRWTARRIWWRVTCDADPPEDRPDTGAASGMRAGTQVEIEPWAVEVGEELEPWMAEGLLGPEPEEAAGAGAA
jgi:glycerol-3-phosphate acyltransferase PlsY